MHPNRVTLLVVTVAAAALAATVGAVQGSSALVHLALDAGPFLLVLALLVRGRFVGEHHLVARYTAARRRPRRPSRRAWPRRPEPALAALLDRGTRPLRGPPLSIAAA